MGIEDTYNNIKLFNNGSISMTGVKSEKKAKMAINYLFQFIIDSNFLKMNPEIKFFNIVLINSDYDIGFELKRSILHQILVNKYKIFHHLSRVFIQVLINSSTIRITLEKNSKVNVIVMSINVLQKLEINRDVYVKKYQDRIFALNIHKK